MRSLPPFAAALLLYGLTAARTVQGGDAGELMTLAATGGAAHPPGYPLFVAWLRLWALVPVGEVALRASLGTAVLAAAAVAVVHRSVRLWTGHAVAAWVAAGALAASGVFWRYATVAEVFTPGALVASLVVLAAARIHAGRDGPATAALLGGALAAGIAHHHTVVLLAPLVGWCVWRLRSRAPLALALLGVVAYLPLLGAEHTWGRIDDLGELVHHVLRRDYGTLSLSGAGHDVPVWTHPVDWALALPIQWVVAGTLLGVLGAMRASRSPGLGRPLVASWILAGPVFLAAFDVPGEGLGPVVAERFHILPAVLFAALIGRAVPELGRWSPLALGILPASLVAYHTLGSHASWTLLDEYTRSVLAEAPPAATVLVRGDSALFALRYQQQVQGLRPDVRVLAPTLLDHPEYAPDVPRAPDLAGLVESLEGPVCLTWALADGQRLPPLTPGGLLLHTAPVVPWQVPVPQVPRALEERTWEGAVLFEYRAAASAKAQER